MQCRDIRKTLQSVKINTLLLEYMFPIEMIIILTELVFRIITDSFGSEM